MAINNFKKQLEGAVEVVEINPTMFQIKSSAKFLNGQPVFVYLKQEKSNWVLSDEKETLKYMNEFYELKSEDVKTCISNVLKIYGFSIAGGRLISKIEEEDELAESYFDYIMCIGQLTNMFAFFDKPE